MSPCPVCRSNRGVERISPAPPVHEGRFWLVEHAYPCSLLGWLVIVLKRHAEALHDLSMEEAHELARLQWSVSRALHEATDCLKEYVMFFAERPGFEHVHIHVVPRHDELDPELISAGIFAHLNADADGVLEPDVVRSFCAGIGEDVRRRLTHGGMP